MLIDRKDVSELVENLHREGKTVVTTNGCFDILHAGHVKYLEKTSTFADKTIVLLNSDKSIKNIKGEGRPVNNENDREIVLSALRYVDYVVIFDEESPRDLLAEIKPDVHTKGADYTAQTLPEADVILSNGGRLEFIEFVEGKSTTKIIERVNNSLTENNYN
jgi:rfaE bifunctional protein nucleotidyltransferase chain/domain